MQQLMQPHIADAVEGALLSCHANLDTAKLYGSLCLQHKPLCINVIHCCCLQQVETCQSLKAAGVSCGADYVYIDSNNLKTTSSANFQTMCCRVRISTEHASDLHALVMNSVTHYFQSLQPQV